MDNITIIGTSHVARQSLDEVRQFIEVMKPDIIAVELDRKRFLALKYGKKRKIGFRDVFRVGVKGFLFSVIGAYAEKKIGESVGLEPGAEMIAAIRLAKKNNIRLELIDQDIELTLKRFSQTFTWREKWHIVKDIFNSIFFREREMKKLGIENLDLSKVPAGEVIEKMMKKVRVDYPNLYKVLVEERNSVMADNLWILANENPGKKILAVVGAGHKEGIELLLNREGHAVSYSLSVS